MRCIVLTENFEWGKKSLRATGVTAALRLFLPIRGLFICGQYLPQAFNFGCTVHSAVGAGVTPSAGVGSGVVSGGGET